MNVLDLFSGIGGFSLGLERAGMRTVAFCEIEPYARRVLAKHWPDVPCYDDVRTLTADRLRADGISVDVICGGFPCQDISLAGKGAGIAEGTRSGLWSEYARLIGELRPSYVVVENVAALLSRGIDRVLGDLASIGYDAEWHCIPASAVGAPHRRDRLWIVAYPDQPGQCPSRGVRRGIGAQQAGDDIRRSSANVADAEHGWMEVGRRTQAAGADHGGSRGISIAGSTRGDQQEDAMVADTERGGLQSGHVERAGSATIIAPAFSRYCGGSEFGSAWRVEPDVGRVAHGISDAMDRIKGLGNAVIPQIPEIIGRAIMRASA
jgi:DNA (cytosine-5)-methyltransferase 1